MMKFILLFLIILSASCSEPYTITYEITSDDVEYADYAAISVNNSDVHNGYTDNFRYHPLPIEGCTENCLQLPWKFDQDIDLDYEEDYFCVFKAGVATGTLTTRIYVDDHLECENTASGTDVVSQCRHKINHDDSLTEP